MGGSALPHIDSSYLAGVFETFWYWCKGKQTNQCNDIVSSETDLLKYARAIDDMMAL